MTKNQAQQRNEKAENLKVFQVGDNDYYCESSEGKICYKVSFGEEHVECTCGDYARNSKTEPNFRCKHILAVFNAVPTGSAEAVSIMKKKMPKLDDRFIMTIEGKEFVKYPGLLDLGHQKGIAGIEVKILQIPNEENAKFAICQATVMSKTGDAFTDIGDANPLNCSSKVVKHLLRMASTRAIARALRSYTNIGMTCLEELADLDEIKGENGSKNKKTPIRSVPASQEPPLSEPASNGNKPPAETQSRPESPAPQTAKSPTEKVRNIDSKKGSAPKAESKPEEKAADTQAVKDQPVMSTAQKNAIYNLSRRRGISVADLEKMSEETYGVAVDYLSVSQASSFIRQLQQAA